MDRRAELKQLAKETKTEAGVYQIRNNRSGKVWIHSSRNVKTINGQRFMLDMGSHHNKQLQVPHQQAQGQVDTHKGHAHVEAATECLAEAETEDESDDQQNQRQHDTGAQSKDVLYCGHCQNPLDQR